MNKRLLKIALFTIVTAAITGLGLVSRAADTNSMASSDAAAALKFKGAVTAVNASARTFTVGDQTFVVTSASQMTKNGSAATIADATVGEAASGTYTKGADGKLDVTKVRFGKKAASKHKKTDSSDSSTGAATPPPNQ